ncbi:hypothetical protein AciPR4_4147 [Terriglobus saanensis SP1PR4]|uniref:Uncharacterized protein n=1 Tax=Terriglobus saanensis (strain ATCC BAA-1853 / DSM 23119 / SP1PR4) TaxID=401053 RepID=E8V5D4_TERSS|nr:hypothetical protein AciPR4_4147 [Terriglobus saanensis SP1PR4]
MPATFNVEDFANEVIVRVSESGRTYSRVVLSALLGSGAGYLFFRGATSRVSQVVICLFITFAVVSEAISSLRGTDVRLQVGNLDLISKGHAPGGYSSSTISRATVERFEYRKASEGGEGPIIRRVSMSNGVVWFLGRVVIASFRVLTRGRQMR